MSVAPEISAAQVAMEASAEPPIYRLPTSISVTVTPDPIIVAADESVTDVTMATEQFNQWLQRSTVEQRQQVINVIVRIFTWLNGAVMALIVVAYVIGVFLPDRQLVTGGVLMALIAGTVTQAGLVFAVMARHLFPQKP